MKEMFRWSTKVEVELVEVLAAGIGMAGPVLLAAEMGRLPLGLAASIGALAMSGVRMRSSAKAQLRGLASALAPAAAASIAATLVADHGSLTDAMVVLLAGTAATIGGYSRRLAVAAIRFVLFLTIISNVAVATPHVAGLLFLVVAGGIWTSVVSMLLGALGRAHRRVDTSADAVATRRATAAQKFSRWKRSLARLSGWQYTLRLVLCLSIAEALRWLWPDHHLYWIAVTVAILTVRQTEAFAVKTMQRALGTALGVAFASLLLAFELPVWGLVIGIGVLAGVRPLLKARNYLVYTVVMTPLVIMIMDAGQSLGGGVLIDRLIATLVGAALVIAANVAAKNFSSPS